MKIPIEFEITEQPVTQSIGDAVAEPARTPSISGDLRRQDLHAIIGELIRQRNELKRDLKKEREDNFKRTRKFYLDLLVIVDSLDRLLRFADPENELTSSINATRAEFLQLLEEYEIVPIEITLGDIFDNETCDAASRKLRSDLPVYTILSIERRGYTWKSKPLRKTRVIISVLPKGE